MTEVKIQLTLHKNQLTVWENSKRFKVLVAGRRWGKTTLAIMALFLKGITKAKAHCFYVAPSYRQAKMVAWRKLKDIIPREFDPKYNESELSCTLGNGSLIELKGAENEESLLGVGLDYLVVDEFASIHDNWKVWNEILRPMLSDKKGDAIFIGTPKGKDAFYELYLKGLNREEGWISYHYTSYTNPIIDPQEIDEAKAQMPERYFRQEYMASFEDFAGLVYPEFEKDSVIKPTYIPAVYPRVGAIDPAISGVTAVLKAAIDDEGSLIIYDEFYERNVRVDEVVSKVYEEDMRWIIDPASAAKNTTKEGNLYSLFDEYRDKGIYAYPGENDVESGINRVAQYFKSGKIKIFSTCTNLIWELERYHWTEPKETITGETKPKPYKKDDHACDTLRYLVMSRPSEADISDPTNVNPNSPLGRMLLGKKPEGFRYERAING